MGICGIARTSPLASCSEASVLTRRKSTVLLQMQLMSMRRFACPRQSGEYVGLPCSIEYRPPQVPKLFRGIFQVDTTAIVGFRKVMGP